MTPPVLHTERLILRAPAAEDFEAWAAFHADPETMRFLGGALPRALAWRGLCAARGAWEIRGYSLFSMIDRETGQWLGRAGPWMPDGWPAPEILWGVAPAFVGLGYAHEAAVAAIDYAVDVLGWSDVMHAIVPANRRSIRLAERLGAVRRRPVTLPPPLEDIVADDWGQSAGAWRARRAQAAGAPKAG